MKVIGVVRSICERTEDFARHLLEKQVSDVKIIKNITPLKKSLIEYLKLGVDYDYLVINDADVFIKPGCVDLMLKKINNSPLITAHTISKFFGKRQGGIRIFNTKYAQEMIKYLESYDNIRPEGSLHLKFNGSLINDVTSIHEYEQNYKDVYLRFIKHWSKSKQYKRKIDEFKNSSDLDLIVAYHGFYDKVKDFQKSFPDLKEKEEILDFQELIDKYKL